jgi:hypothetical protein
LNHAVGDTINPQSPITDLISLPLSGIADMTAPADGLVSVENDPTATSNPIGV